MLLGDATKNSNLNVKTSYGGNTPGGSNNISTNRGV